MAVEVYIIKMTDHMETCEIIRWLVRENARVEAGQGILEIQTDKAIVELEAPAAGILTGIRPGVEEGVEIPVGVTIAFIAEPGEVVPALPPIGSDIINEHPPVPPRSAPETELPRSEQHEPDDQPGEALDRVRAVPAVRSLARTLGVDLAQVTGTGPGGRITRDDVETFAKSK